MQEPKELIKSWLKATNRDREWLGSQLGVKKRAVDNWLSTSNPIPESKLALIKRLIADDEAAEAQRKQQLSPVNQVFSLEVDLPRFRRYSAAALAAAETLEHWSIHALDSAAANATTIHTLYTRALAEATHHPRKLNEDPSTPP